MIGYFLMIGYFFWFVIVMLIASNFTYSLFGIKEFSDYLALIGVCGFVLAIGAILISIFCELIKLDFLKYIFVPLMMVGILLTGTLTVIYPVIGFVKVIPIAYTGIVDIFVSDPDYNDVGEYDDIPYDDYYNEDGTGTHHVDPHWVDGYERSDGTQVEGYWRGGSDGYERSNPDGNPSNNLNSDSDSGGFDISDWDILGW